MDYKRIESELRCPACGDLFKYPVQLPCGHNICAGCTEKCLSTTSSSSSRRLSQDSLEKGSSETTSNMEKDSVILESDQISMVSDADSGVVCGSGNKRDSVISGSERGLLYLTCPSTYCHKTFLTEDPPGKTFPPNRLMMKILSKYTSSLLNSPAGTPTNPAGNCPSSLCQLCEGEPKRPAVIFCQQCEIFYCQTCRDSFHPQRGPLQTHKLMTPADVNVQLNPPPTVTTQQQLHNNYICAALEQQKCPLHNQDYTMYCSPCRQPLCWRCLDKDTIHQEQHDLQALQGLSKTKKADFSKQLQLLSEKSKRMSEWVTRIKETSSRIPDVGLDIEASITAQCDHLVQLIDVRRKQLLSCLNDYKEQKQREIKENQVAGTAMLQQAAAQIYFGLEVLRETEAVNFLQFSGPLYQKVIDTGSILDETLEQPWTPELNVRFDSRPIAHMIETLQLQHVTPPCTPRLSVEDCRIINGRISLSWESKDPLNTDFYTVEVAESGGEFSKAYYGPDTTCCLNFSAQTMIYQARLKAVNVAGESPYSDVVTLHVEGGYFTWEVNPFSRDIQLSNDGLTITSTASEDTVVMASAGFLRGVHYWEVVVDRYDHRKDPAFGICTAAVRRDAMLGKDGNGWSVYIDAERSWCFHSGQHLNRMDGGIAPGCTVGILLDLDQRNLSFFVNEEPQAPVPAFENLPEGLIYYPAVSLNRSVSLTLRPSLEPPLFSPSPL